MKKIIFIIPLLIICIVAHGQQKANTSFKFPCTQGDYKWQQFESVGERIAALQIPDSIIKQIPTEELLAICLDFPYITDILFYDDYQTGFEHVKKSFNGLRELLTRKDLYDALVYTNNEYINELDKIQTAASLIEKGKFSFKHFMLEFIMAQDCVVIPQNKAEEKNIVSVIATNMELKEKYPDIFSQLNIIPSYVVFAKKMLQESNVSLKTTEIKNKITNFINKPLMLDSDIVEETDNYIKQRTNTIK